jgi:hypothetical protein
MANIRKSFNLRNGVQVDDDNFIVNANGLVGIGTSVPREFLDVRGNVQVVGHTTSNTLYAGFSTIGSLVVTEGIQSTGVITATSFSGSASGLTGIYAIAVDGWYIDSGNSSISTSFKVGIGTTNSQYSLQIGNPDSAEGISFDAATGDIVSTGEITATSFNGSLDSVNLTGTISSDRLPVLPNSKIPNNFQVTGIITALGTFKGDLVGIATTARDLTSDARISIAHIAANTSNIGVSTISTRLNAATIGVNTNSTQADVHIVDATNASLHLTAPESQITLGRSLSPTGNTGGLRFGNTSNLYPSSTTKSLDIINYDTGNLNYYLHYGAAGVGTGNFNWLYGPNSSNLNSPLMTLTYKGNLGLGVTTPVTKLQVSGIASVSELNVTGSIYATGVGATTTIKTLYVTDGESGIRDSSGASLFGKNLNLASGISTFYDVEVTNYGIFQQRIAIGNTAPCEFLHIGGDWKVDPEDAVVISSSGIGIGTTSIGFGAGIDGRGVEVLFGAVGVGTTTSDALELGFSNSTLVNINGPTAIFNGDLFVGKNQSTGVVLTSPNGTKYRLVVANNGTLSTTAV